MTSRELIGVLQSQYATYSIIPRIVYKCIIAAYENRVKDALFGSEPILDMYSRAPEKHRVSIQCRRAFKTRREQSEYVRALPTLCLHMHACIACYAFCEMKASRFSEQSDMSTHRLQMILTCHLPPPSPNHHRGLCVCADVYSIIIANIKGFRHVCTNLPTCAQS